MVTPAQQDDKLSRSQPWMYNFRLPDGSTTLDATDAHYNRKCIDRNLKVLQALDVSGKRVLDMGCSEGLYSFYLAEQGADVLGVDIDEQRIGKADFLKKELAISNVRFECGNVLDPVFRQTLQPVDLILAWGFLHRITDPFNALFAMCNLSKAISLEWQSLVIPFASRLSFASHPFGKSFEWKNMAGMKRSDIEENKRGSQKDRVAFWYMTSGAIKAITERMGCQRFCFPERKAERLKRYPRSLAYFIYTALHFNIKKAVIPTIRLHMLCEKEANASIWRAKRSSDLKIARWDAA